MILKLFKSTKDLTEDKIRNPFFGTYIFVWIIRNWELIYTLIYFDKETKLSNRLLYIKEYFENKNVILELWNNLWITFIVFLTSYILLNLSRFISNFSELKIKPLINKTVDSNSVVTKKRFKSLENQRNDLQQSLENTRDSLSTVENELKNKILEIKTLNKTNHQFKKLKLEHESNIENLREETVQFGKMIKHQKLIDKKLRDTLYSYIIFVFKKIGGEYLADFNNLYDSITNSEMIESPLTKKFKDRLLRYFLIEEDENDNIVFTKIGHIVRKSSTFNDKGSIDFDAYKGIRAHIDRVTIKKL